VFPAALLVSFCFVAVCATAVVALLFGFVVALFL
jgi:hypothetical protein